MPTGIYPRLYHKPVLQRFNEKWIPEPYSGCWLWTGSTSPNGYGKLGIEGGKTIYAHRTAWLLLKGNIPDGLCVLHRCDTRACVNPDHLFLGTKLDNTRDAISKGRHSHGPGWPLGEQHPSHKLTASQVIEIRRDGRKYKELAKAYGVSLATINAIRQRRKWRHLP